MSIHNGARPRHLARARLRHLARREVSVQVLARRFREHEVVRGVVGAHLPCGPDHLRFVGPRCALVGARPVVKTHLMFRVFVVVLSSITSRSPSSVMLVVSHAIALCVSRRVSPLLVYFRRVSPLLVFLLGFHYQQIFDDLAVFFIPSVCRTEFFAMQRTLAAFIVGAGAQRCARLEEDASLEMCRAQTARLLLPWQLIDAMDRSVEELGPEPPACWRHGQPMQLMMATVRCWHHRSQPHHQHRRDVLQDVASA